MKTLRGAGLRSLAVALPRSVRTNDYFRREQPQLLASIEERALGKVWAVREGEAKSDFELEMMPYMKDPFRGTLERRVLADDEPAMAISVPAAKTAAAVAQVDLNTVDLLVSATFPSDQVGIGEAAFLARALGLSRSAWNLESACSSALVGLDVACALVEAGRHERVLVVTSCIYSRVTDPSDTLSFTSGDAAAAFLVEPCGVDDGVLARHDVHTAETCDAIHYELRVADNKPVMRMATRAGARDALRDVAERTVLECCNGAAEKAGVKLADITAFVPNAPTAWFAAFFARRLGVDRERVVDIHPWLGNVGPALWPIALHHAALNGRIKKGDLVMVYSVGSVASAAAAVIRWGDVALGPAAAPAEVHL